MKRDSTEKAEAEFRRLMMARSPEERLIMACRMFSTAKALVEAGIRHQHGDLPPEEMRRRIFLRLYGQDFPEAEIERMLARWPASESTNIRPVTRPHRNQCSDSSGRANNAHEDAGQGETT